MKTTTSPFYRNQKLTAQLLQLFSDQCCDCSPCTPPAVMLLKQVVSSGRNGSERGGWKISAWENTSVMVAPTKLGPSEQSGLLLPGDGMLLVAVLSQRFPLLKMLKMMNTDTLDLHLSNKSIKCVIVEGFGWIQNT